MLDEKHSAAPHLEQHKQQIQHDVAERHGQMPNGAYTHRK